MLLLIISHFSNIFAHFNTSTKTVHLFVSWAQGPNPPLPKEAIYLVMSHMLINNIIRYTKSNHLNQLGPWDKHMLWIVFIKIISPSSLRISLPRGTWHSPDSFDIITSRLPADWVVSRYQIDPYIWLTILIPHISDPYFPRLSENKQVAFTLYFVQSVCWLLAWVKSKQFPLVNPYGDSNVAPCHDKLNKVQHNVHISWHIMVEMDILCILLPVKYLTIFIRVYLLYSFHH